MVKKASLRADAPVTLKPPPAPPRRSSRHTSVADPGSSSDNTPEKGQNPSIASTPKPPSTLTKQAPSQRHDRAQSSVSRVATTDDDDQQEESRLDTDDDQQDSNNHTELTTDEMRVQVFAKWFCAPEQVIPHNLIQPKKRGLTFNASLVAILHQICALDVDLAVAQEALEEAVKQDEQNFLGYEQLETALTKAFDLKNGKLKPASGEDSEGQPSEGPVGDDDEEAGASKDDAEEDAANSGATTHGKVDHGDHQSTKKGDKSRLKGNNPADKRKSTEAPADQGPPKKKHRANSKNGPKDGSGDGDDMPQRPEKDPAKSELYSRDHNASLTDSS